MHYSLLRGKSIRKIYVPCLTETYRLLKATKHACGMESSRTNSSSLVTVVERVLRMARLPVGDKYCPILSLRAKYPLWNSSMNKQLATSKLVDNLPSNWRYALVQELWMAYLWSRNSKVNSVSSPHGTFASTWKIRNENVKIRVVRCMISSLKCYHITL